MAYVIHVGYRGEHGRPIALDYHLCGFSCSRVELRTSNYLMGSTTAIVTSLAVPGWFLVMAPFLPVVILYWLRRRQTTLRGFAMAALKPVEDRDAF